MSDRGREGEERERKKNTEGDPSPHFFLSPPSALLFSSVFPSSPKSDRGREGEEREKGTGMWQTERKRWAVREEQRGEDEKESSTAGETARGTHLSWSNYSSALCSQGKAQTESTSTAQASAEGPRTRHDASAGFALFSSNQVLIHLKVVMTLVDVRRCPYYRARRTMMS